MVDAVDDEAKEDVLQMIACLGLEQLLHDAVEAPPAREVHGGPALIVPALEKLVNELLNQTMITTEGRRNLAAGLRRHLAMQDELHAPNDLRLPRDQVERFIRFLGHLAYIETAIYGTNFCRSLLKAFKRLIKNAIR